MAYATLTVEGVFTEEKGAPTLTQMQKFVRGPTQVWGLVEVVRLKHGIDMWINEEGKYEDPNINTIATIIAHDNIAIFPEDYIAGPAIFTGFNPKTGATIGLNQKQLAYLELFLSQSL